MAERIFDYNNVSTVYQNMKKITGDAGDSESIAGILHKIDEEVHNKVDVCEEAIFGDLGKQMLLDWDNTSANFDNFVTNFSNWSTLIAQSAGNYSQFEQDIAGFKQANPLGVTSGGITDAYTNTGYYANSYSSDEIKELEDLAVFYDLTGATYIDTGMVEFAKKNKIYRIATVALDLVGLIASVGTAVKIAKASSSIVSTAASTSKTLATSSANLASLSLASKSAGGYAAKNLARAVGGGKIMNSSVVNSAIKAAQNTAMKATWYGKFASEFATSFAKGTLGNSNFWKSVKAGAQGSRMFAGTAAASGFASNITYALGSDYDINKYGSGYENSTMMTGQVFSVDNKEYVFIGSTSQGTNVFTDDNNKIYYLSEDGKMNSAVVVNSNGDEVDATYDNTMVDTFEMKLGNEIVTETDSLSSSVSYNLREYNDNLDSSYESTFVDSTVNQDEKLEENLGTN